ncbi:hypothetical protein ACP70R_031746 [Stipagrostis hirtigluma subsp. patula]
MDKSWMDISDRRLPRYEEGAKQFIEFAFADCSPDKHLRCPCRICKNNYFADRSSIMDHIMINGVLKDYKIWDHHGETISDSEDTDTEIEDHDDYGMREMLNDFGDAVNVNMGSFEGQTPGLHENMESSSVPDEETSKFYRVLDDADQELYPGCHTFSTLSFIVQMMNIKCLYDLSGNAMDALFSLFWKALPTSNKAPKSFNDAKKVMSDLGLDYKRIDACLNDCILYRDKFANCESCPVCGLSRWKDEGKNNASKSRRRRVKKVAQKVLRYFPLIPRLKRMYMCSKTATHMRWHKEKIVDDGCMRHPANSKEWKHFDAHFPAFAADARNVRLGLASDGFNPFGNMSTSYSIWPVVIVMYNLPPWMCMKDPYMITSMLIPGPKAPGNDIDVYLQPLIDELLQLWDGVQAYDAATKRTFKLQAALLWTINDFPALGNLSGMTTKGKYACPCCHTDTCYQWLVNGRKSCYMGHRRFLPARHAWRNNSKSFNGQREKRCAPKALSGDDALDQYDKFAQVIFGKSEKKRKRSSTLYGVWKKKSIFFQLPYWRILTLWHNLDIMHIEKNVCDAFVGTVLNQEGKTKDNIKSRFDMELMGIRPELHAPPTGDGKYLFQRARYTMALPEKKTFCENLTQIKVPDGYSSKVSHYVDPKNGKISGMKCHDCHVFLHRYFPLSIRGMLPADVCEPIIELCNFFRELCSKVLDMEVLQKLDSTIAVTLCKLEKIFPPSLFDIMIHLPIHLAQQAMAGGPVQYRWMYPIERFLRRLKSYVKNKARPEGAIAEAIILQESVTLCSMYLHGVETRINRPSRNDDCNVDNSSTQLQIFANLGRPLLGNKYCEIEMNELEKARIYILKNCEEVSQYARNHISALYSKGDPSISDELFDLARGPDSRVTHFSSYMINGWRFNTRERDALVQAQNSGVLVKGDEETGNKDYFGVVTDIVELSYGLHKVVLFKCDWWDVHTTRGVKEDRYGFTMINTTRKLSTNDPYVLAAQAEQVYYVKDTKDPKWYVVIKTKPRDYYDIPPTEEEIGVMESNKSSPEACQENEEITITHNPLILQDNDDTTPLNIPDAQAEAQAVEANPILHTENGADDEDEQESESDESDGGEYIDSDDEEIELDEDTDND